MERPNPLNPRAPALFSRQERGDNEVAGGKNENPICFHFDAVTLLALAAGSSASAEHALGVPDAAKVFNVTKTADTNDGACTPADCSLREAVIAANANPGMDTVVIPAGVYVLTITGINENGAGTGDLDIGDDLNLVGVNRTTTDLLTEMARTE